MESTEKSLLLGTPGDYRPMAYHEPFTDSYRGFDIELAWRIAAELGYEVVFKEISWDMLAHDAKTDAFDMAIGGISRTPQRKEELILSDSYLETGKTILCREVDAARFDSLADVDRPGVRVLYNPGGTNEDFVKTHLHHADCRVFARNAAIPDCIAAGKADVMITETVEAAFYTRQVPALAAPLLAHPFTREAFCIVMSRKRADMVRVVNLVLADFRARGILQGMAKRYFDY